MILDSKEPLPFEVEPHRLIFVRVAGRVEKTVLTIERQIYTWRICEYEDTWSIGRFWCYHEFSDALSALLVYVDKEGVESKEPEGWHRAVDGGCGAPITRGCGGYRVRKVQYAYGERRIVEVEE